ncbi:MAG: hypothetical protein ACJAZO_002973, partial [Myxococcota bacterium]
MSSKSLFTIMLRRQPGYELLLTIRFESNKHAGVVSLSRPGWVDSTPSRSKEIRDVDAAELRGGRFTLIHDGSERREGYSLARVTEPLLGRIPDNQWTELDPVTEFGFRYLQIPEGALAGTPATAAVRTKLPAPAATPMPVDSHIASATAQTSRPAGRSSLLERARHSGGASLPPGPSGDPMETAAPETTLDDRSSPPDGVVRSTHGASVRLAKSGEVEVRSARSLPPKPRPVATASGSGTPAPSRMRAPHSLPGAVPAAPVAVEASLADLALQSLSADALRVRLQSEMRKVQELHLRLSEAERRMGESQERERDLLAVL